MSAVATVHGNAAFDTQPACQNSDEPVQLREEGDPPALSLAKLTVLWEEQRKGLGFARG